MLAGEFRREQETAFYFCGVLRIMPLNRNPGQNYSNRNLPTQPISCRKLFLLNDFPVRSTNNYQFVIFHVVLILQIVR